MPCAHHSDKANLRYGKAVAGVGFLIALKNTGNAGGGSRQLSFSA